MKARRPSVTVVALRLGCLATIYVKPGGRVNVVGVQANVCV